MKSELKFFHFLDSLDRYCYCDCDKTRLKLNLKMPKMAKSTILYFNFLLRIFKEIAFWKKYKLLYCSKWKIKSELQFFHFLVKKSKLQRFVTAINFNQTPESNTFLKEPRGYGKCIVFKHSVLSMNFLKKREIPYSRFFIS